MGLLTVNLFEFESSDELALSLAPGEWLESIKGNSKSEGPTSGVLTPSVCVCGRVCVLYNK